ncbi:MAG: aglU [Myxococcaceae bacterium]|nr:aglU [Myxococcaceae bacterium]
MRLVLGVAVAVLAVGCKNKSADEPAGGVSGSRVSLNKVMKGEAGVGSLGVKRVGGIGIDLRATADGQHLTWLLDAEKPRLDGLPPPMRVGVLWAVPARGGDSRKLGNGVTNMPGGYLFSADGRWVLFLAGYNPAEQSGELRVADLSDPASAPERLGGRVTYMLASPDSKQIAFVDEGMLRTGPLPKGPFREVAGEVATAEFSPDSSTLYFRRRVANAGGLYQVPLHEVGKAPRKIADQVGDFRLTPDGKTVAYAARPSAGSSSYELFVADTGTLKPRQLARNVIAFRFSPDGKLIAHNEGLSPEDPGDLFVGPYGGGGAEPKALGAKVKDFQFSPDSKSIAFREGYSDNEGDLAVAVIGSAQPAKKISRRVRSYSWSDDNLKIAFTIRVVKPITSVDLVVWRVGDEEATKIKQWVYDYDFTPQSDRLLFRTDCSREGRSCDLLALDLKDLKLPPKKLVEAMSAFKISESGERVLITYSRAQTGDFYDVAVFNLKSNERKTLEQFIRLPAMFLDKDGTKVAYVVAEQNKSGVYVADQVP